MQNLKLQTVIISGPFGMVHDAGWRDWENTTALFNYLKVHRTQFIKDKVKVHFRFCDELKFDIDFAYAGPTWSPILKLQEILVDAHTAGQVALDVMAQFPTDYPHLSEASKETDN